jgi:hypothetical protein
MERAKRARTAETPKQPSLCLRLCAPYFYPDYDEGVAIHIGPEPCVGSREGIGEASAGERAGQPSSRESLVDPGADAVPTAEGNTDGGASASLRTARRGPRPWHARTLLGREPGDLAADRRQPAADPVRIGKARSRSR